MKLPSGRYLVGLDLGVKEPMGTMLIPIGPRNDIQWHRAQTVSMEEFNEALRARRDELKAAKK